MRECVCVCVKTRVVYHLKATRGVSRGREGADAAAFIVLCTDIINPRIKWTTQILREANADRQEGYDNIMKLMCLKTADLLRREHTKTKLRSTSDTNLLFILSPNALASDQLGATILN